MLNPVFSMKYNIYIYIISKHTNKELILYSIELFVVYTFNMNNCYENISNNLVNSLSIFILLENGELVCLVSHYPRNFLFSQACTRHLYSIPIYIYIYIYIYIL